MFYGTRRTIQAMLSIFARWRDHLKQYTALRQLYGALYSAYWSCRTRALQAFRTLWFPFTVRHVHGPRDIPTRDNDLVVVCLVRNGELYVEEFIDHYQRLGARHLVFLDNGSTDDTISLVRDHERTTVLASDADFGAYKTVMRRYLISRYGTENWVLCADIDEFFDYPFSDHLGLGDFLAYLNENGYNAVALQMLDMLPGKSFSEIDPESSFRESHVYYDISSISAYEYASNSWLEGNVIDNSDLKTHRGGVRRELFDTRPDRPLLTKHTLLRLTRGLRPKDIRMHHIDNAFIADVSGVLYHFKFNAKFFEYAQRVAKEGTFANNSEEYVSYLETLQNGDPALRTDTMSRLDSVQELVERDFLTTSTEFKDYAYTVADT